MEAQVDEAQQVAGMLRGVLAELADPESELTASAAMRHRIEGAVLALEATTGPDEV